MDKLTKMLKRLARGWLGAGEWFRLNWRYLMVLLLSTLGAGAITIFLCNYALMGETVVGEWLNSVIPDHYRVSHAVLIGMLVLTGVVMLVVMVNIITIYDRNGWIKDVDPEAVVEKYERKKKTCKYIWQNKVMITTQLVLGLMTLAAIGVLTYYVLVYIDKVKWVYDMGYPYNLMVYMAIVCSMPVIAVYMVFKVVDAVEAFWDKHFGIKKLEET